MSTYLWQNFLKDSTYTIFIAQKVAQFSDKFGLEQCIEIGPGKGALTKKLIQIVRKPLLLLEKDETLLTQLHATIALALTKTDPEPTSTPLHHSPDIQMYEPTIKMGDALQLDVASELQQIWRDARQTVVVGNLPYYITSPLLTKFFGWWNAVFPVGVFMVQKEVADKIKTDASKKSYLWRLLNYQYEVTYLKTVPAKAFTPAPKVQSAIFSLVSRALTSKTATSSMSDESSNTPWVNITSQNFWSSTDTLPSRPSFSYEKMIELLNHISLYKRKTLWKCRKMAWLQWTYNLPEDLAGKRLEEIGLADMERILS